MVKGFREAPVSQFRGNTAILAFCVLCPSIKFGPVPSMRYQLVFPPDFITVIAGTDVVNPKSTVVEPFFRVDSAKSTGGFSGSVMSNTM